MKIKIRDDLVVEARSLIGLEDNDWEEYILNVVYAGHDIKTGSGIFYDCLSTVFYNIDYKDIIIEDGILIAKGKK